MIYSCRSTPKCPCNSSTRGDTSCWCYKHVVEDECQRCGAPMTKALQVPFGDSPLFTPTVGTEILEVSTNTRYRWDGVKWEPTAQSGLREGQKVPDGT